LSILNNVSEFMNTSRTITSEDSASIAAISNILEQEKLDQKNELERHLLYLSKRAAGKYHTDYSSHKDMLNADQPNNILADTWRVAIQNLSRKDPVLAAQTSYKTVLTTGTGCRVGYYARKSLFENIESWSRKSSSQSLTALHDTVLRSIGMNSNVPELLLQGSTIFSKLCNTKTKRNALLKSEQLLNLYTQVSLNCAEETEESIRVKLDLSNKLLDCAELLYEKNAVKSQQILKSLESLYFSSAMNRDKKARYAKSLALYSNVESETEFLENYNKIKRLTHKQESQHQTLWPFLNRRLESIRIAEHSDSSATLNLIKKYMLPYLQNDSESFKVSRQAFKTCIEEITKNEPLEAISHLRYVADRIRPHSEIFDSILDEIYSIALANVDIDPVASYESFAYVANKAQPYKPIQVNALREIYHNVIDKVAALDNQKAMAVARDYVLLAHNIGTVRVRSIEPFFKISKPINNAHFQESLPIVKDFVKYAEDNPHIDNQLVNKFSELATIASDDESINVMAHNVEPEGQLSPLCQRALNKYFKLMDDIGEAEDKLEPLIQMSLQSSRSYEIQRPINKALLDLIEKTGKTNGSEAIHLCIHTLEKLEKNDARYSNLYYSVREAIAPILSNLADENVEKTKQLLKKVKKLRAFSGSYYLEPIWKVEEKCKKNTAVNKLSERLDVSPENIKSLEYNSGQLRRAYNRYSLFDSASKAIHDNQTKIGVWGFVIGALAGISYIENSGASGWIPLLSGIGSVVIATAATAFSSKAMEQANISFKTKLTSYGDCNGNDNVSGAAVIKENSSSAEPLKTSMKPSEFIKKHKI
jgi:hypothetical protein